MATSLRAERLGEILPPEGIDSPECGSWWTRLGPKGQRMVMDALNERVTMFGEAPDKHLQAIFESCSKISRAKNLTSSDFRGGQETAYLRQALGYVNKDDISQADRRYGSVSHTVVHLLLEGKIPEIAPVVKVPLIRGVQLSLLGEVAKIKGEAEKDTQMELTIADFNPQREWPSLSGISRISHLPEVVISDIERAAADYTRDLENRDIRGRVDASRRARPLLLAMLNPILGDFVKKLPRFGEEHADHLFTLALLEWARALSFAARERSERIFFREISVIDNRCGVSLGRMDALEVTQVDGRAPNERERKFLSQLSRNRFRSGAHLFHALTKLLGNDVVVTLSDLKCGVGDFHGNGDMISLSECPKKDHIEQVKKYRALEPIAWAMYTGWEPQRMDFNRAYIGGSYLMYLLPTYGLFNCEVAMTGVDLAETFRKGFVSKWGPARASSKHRDVTRDTLKTFIKGSLNPVREKETQQLGFLGKQTTIGDIVDMHRSFVDRLKIVEESSYRGKVLYRLHYDELCKAVGAGNVEVLTFDPETGGRIRCLSGKHPDYHPAMSVSLQRGIFFCYACHFSGVIAEESLTQEELKGVVYSPRLPLEKIIIPSECHDIIGRAHRFMNREFPGSPAEDYLAKERGLDPEVAFAHDAGYGGCEFVSELLDYGATLDELASLGLITYSPRITKEDGLVRELRDYGFKLSELARPCKLTVGGRRVVKQGFPYTRLADKVTFPLKLMGYYTNIYGRAIKPVHKDMRHRKLSVMWNGKMVPQGGYNFDAIEGKEVLVTEAPIDALTLIEMGHHAVAVIGTHNRYILEEVRRKAGGIHLAFNNDEPGFAATRKVLYNQPREDKVKEEDFKHLSDFTYGFFRSAETSAKDYNAWWMEQKKT